MLPDQWRKAATITCKTPLNTETRHNLIMALMREESVILDGTVLVMFESPPGDRFIYGENQKKRGFVAGETFDLWGCANAVEWAEAQLANPEE